MHTTSGKTSTGDWKGVFDAGFSVMKRMDFRHGASPMKIDEDCRKSLRFIADLPEYGHSPLPCSSTRESLIHLCLRSMISIWSSNYPLCQIRSPKKLELGCFWIHIPHVQHLCVLYVLDIYVIHCNIYIYISIRIWVLYILYYIILYYIILYYIILYYIILYYIILYYIILYYIILYIYTYTAHIASIPRWRPNPYAREDADFALQNIRQTMRPFSSSDCGNGQWAMGWGRTQKDKKGRCPRGHQWLSPT